MTRAMQKLYMTHARSRMRWGERSQQMPSRFLDEVDPATVSREATRRRPAAAERHGSDLFSPPAAPSKAKRRSRSEYSQVTEDSYSQEEARILVGTQVTHATFGRGRVLDLNGTGDMARAVVLFESVGKKTLVLKFAALLIT